MFRGKKHQTIEISPYNESFIDTIRFKQEIAVLTDHVTNAFVNINGTFCFLEFLYIGFI